MADFSIGFKMVFKTDCKWNCFGKFMEFLSLDTQSKCIWCVVFNSKPTTITVYWTWSDSNRLYVCAYCIYSTCTFESVFLKRTILRFIFILPSISFFFFFFCFDIIFLFRSRSRSRTRSRLNDISWFTLTVTVFFFVSIRTLIAYSSYLFHAYYIRVLRSCTTYWFYFPSSFSHGDDRMGDSSGGDWRLAYSVLVGGVLFFIQ